MPVIKLDAAGSRSPMGGAPAPAPLPAPVAAPAPTAGMGGVPHPAAAIPRPPMAATPFGPSNPAPSGSPMGGAPHPAAQMPGAQVRPRFGKM